MCVDRVQKQLVVTPFTYIALYKQKGVATKVFLLVILYAVKPGFSKRHEISLKFLEG
jgi:hypothetical protein